MFQQHFLHRGGRLRHVVITLLLASFLTVTALVTTYTVAAATRIPARPMSCTCPDFQPFVHTVTTANISGTSTFLNEIPLNENSVLVVTPTWSDKNGNCGCINDPHPLGVWFNGANWAIFHEDGAPMVPGTMYNVALASDNRFGFFHTATAANMVGNWTVLNDMRINGNPNAVIVVTQEYDAGDTCGCVINNHSIGVLYLGNVWVIMNEDNTPIPLGAQFNVALPELGNGWTTSPMTGSSSTDFLNDSRINGLPNLLLFATPVYNPWKCGCVYDTHPTGVYYAAAPAVREWAIYNEDDAVISPGMIFNILVLTY
jgi:hypothetical protein